METNAEVTDPTIERVTREKLAQDLKSLVQDAEELLKATSGDVSEKASAARKRLTAALDRAKISYHRCEEAALAGARATDKVIRDHPYQTIGAAFGIGLLIGVLVNRK